MSTIKFCGFLLTACFLFSCQPHRTKNKIILRAETFIYSAPDSAYQLLISIPHPENLPDADYSAWCLLYTHAQYKLQQDITSDSLILISVNYYRNSQMTKQSGTACYLLGCIERKLNKNKDAMEAFKKAEYILKATNENKLKGLTDFNLGYICMQDELYNHSLAYFKKSLKYFQLTNDKNYQAYAYREISDMYIQLDYPFDSVLHYSNLALKFSKESGDSVNYYSIMSRQGALLYDKDYALSKEYILKGYKFFPAQRSYYAAFLSYTYSKLNKPDSARYYLQIAIADTLNLESRIIKFHAGALLSKGEGDYKQALNYMEKAYVNRDSVFQESIHSQLYRIDKQYDLTRKEEENAALKIANRNKVILITMLTIAVLVFVLILLLIKNRTKKKQAAYEIEKQRLEFEFKVKQVENSQKRELLLSKLQSRVENTLNLNRLKSGLLKQEKKEEFIEEITKQATLSEKEWQYYIDEVNHIFDRKIANLSETYTQLTHSDIIVITLICLGLDVTDSCSLLNMSQNTLYVRRKRIKKHIGLKEEDLEDWINTSMASLINS